LPTGSRILHQGRIIVDGTLAELKRLLPPAKVEYVREAALTRRRLLRGRR